MNELARLRGSERYGACDDEGKTNYEKSTPSKGLRETTGDI